MQAHMQFEFVSELGDENNSTSEEDVENCIRIFFVT
jgi:hypothetical protein